MASKPKAYAVTHETSAQRMNLVLLNILHHEGVMGKIISDSEDTQKEVSLSEGKERVTQLMEVMKEQSVNLSSLLFPYVAPNGSKEIVTSTEANDLLSELLTAVENTDRLTNQQSRDELKQYVMDLFSEVEDDVTKAFESLTPEE